MARGAAVRKHGGVLLPRPSSASRAAGVLRPWPAILVTWGTGGATRLHAHHCWHLIVGLDAGLAVTTRAGGRPRRAGALITAPDAPHAVDARGTRALIVFVEPESDAGERLLATRGRASIGLYRDADAEQLRAVLSPEGPALADPEDAVARALSLGGEPVAPPPGRHPGVRRVLRYLRQAAPETDTSLGALAQIAGLSPGRFMHAFTETVHIPLRPYLRWLKLERAGAALAAGASLGEAAYGAGFADAAHMSRTFVRMFGVSPSDVRRRSQSVQDG
jgi:AraC-like DNA-binding protein